MVDFTNMETETLTACPICSSEELEDFFTHIHPDRPLNEWQLCHGCGQVFANPRATKAWIDNFYKKDYRSMTHAASKEKIDPKNVREEVMRSMAQGAFLRRMIEEVDWHLDIGSSTGALMATMQDFYSSKNVGIEPNDVFRNFSEERFKISQEEAAKHDLEDKYSMPLHYATLEEYKDRKKFGLITISHTLEHVLDPVALLTEAKKRSKKDGYLFVECPSLFAAQIQPLIFPHFFVFTTTTLPVLIRDSGWTVVEIESFGNPAPAFPGPSTMMVLAKNGTVTMNKEHLLGRIAMQGKHEQALQAAAKAQQYEVG
jgi:2-polyprenyl-3-methyl-5-hydroxy-6-metoxy-1,4-benzoquinol methylase